MVQAMLKLWNSAAELISWHEPQSAPKPEPDEQHKLGGYYADYTPLTPVQLEASKAECAEHIARSKVVSVKSGL